MCCVAGTLAYISNTTGFDRYNYFEDPEQVREYFKVEIMEGIYPEWSKEPVFKKSI
jgi:hypothetical protein